MPRTQSRFPTELELDILKVLWKGEPLTGAQIRDRLANGGRDLAYTTVMTMLAVMLEKGSVSRAKHESGFQYRSAIDEVSTQQGMLSDIVTRVFDGSTMAAMVNLLGSDSVTSDELDELRKLIQERKRETDQ